MRSRFEDAINNISNEIVMLHEVCNHDDKNSFTILILLSQQCKHPNIVEFIACHYWDEQIYVIMEYCDGGTLRKLIELKRLTEEQVFDLG